MKGIDVSKYQGVIDWAKAVKAGIEFAIIKATYGWDNDAQIDPQMVNNVQGCEANGIPYGFFHYSYAESPEDAAKEAAFFLRHIKQYKPSMPIAFDFEEPFQVGGTDNKGIKHGGFSPEKQLSIIEAFMSVIEAAGYFGVLYMSKSALQRLYDYAPARVSKYSAWVAHVNVSATNYTGKYGIWQYSWKGCIYGIKGDVDMDICYLDYPNIIKNAGLNGWGKITGQKNSTEPDYKALYEEAKVKADKFDRIMAIAQS